jgi:hypothetical protein
MESKQPTHKQSKTSHPTVLGVLFFTLFNLILLSILSWIILEVWFSVQLVFFDAGINIAIQKMLNSNISMLAKYDFQLLDDVLNIFQGMQNGIHSWCGSYMGGNFVEIFIGVTEIILIRCCIFFAFIPFMIVILCILVIDGLVQRDKRKFQGARESTFLFHRLKPLAKLSFFSLFFIYMIVPYEISPDLFLVPMVMLSSLFTMLAIRSFKKYL